MGNVQNVTKDTITALLGNMGVGFEAVDIIEIAGQKLYSLTFSDSQGDLFTAHSGELLNALSVIVSRLVEKELDNGERTRITIDVNGLKKLKIDTVVNSALVQASRAKELKYDVELQPSNPYERMLVHAVLAGDKSLETGSIGEGDDRRVVIRFVG